jgi:hypothetical protein
VVGFGAWEVMLMLSALQPADSGLLWGAILLFLEIEAKEKL